MHADLALSETLRSARAAFVAAVALGTAGGALMVGQAWLLSRTIARVFIDEYQDIDALQYELVAHLVPADGHICAIGDPDQAIYGFRGSDPGPGTRTQNLQKFHRHGVYLLEQTTGDASDGQPQPGNGHAALG